MVGGCQVDFKNVTSTNGEFKLEVIDGSANILVSYTIGTFASIKIPSLYFPCPTTPTTMKMRVTSLSTGTIEVDHAYLGSNQNLVYTSQAKLLGTITWATTASCSWSVTNTAFTVFPADADCPAPTVTGELAAPGTKIPGFTLANYRKGDYKIEAVGAFANSTAQTAVSFRFSDGTNVSKGTNSVHAQQPATLVFDSPTIAGTISNAIDQSGVTVQIQGASSSGAAVINSDSNLKSLSMSVWYYPSVSEVAVSNEQANWYIDANIFGTNPTLVGAVASYTEITGSALTLALNSGSATAEIPCSTTNPSTGLTCAAGSESLGIAFVPPSPGRYRACFYYARNYGTGTSTTQLIETPNNAQTLLQEGNVKLMMTEGVGSTSTFNAETNCSFFNFSDTSKRTIRLMAEVNSGTMTVSTARDAAVGQQDLHITIENVNFPQNRPYFTGDQVITPGAVRPVVYSFKVDGAAGTVSNEIGDLINGNCTHNATGDNTCLFNASALTALSTPNCVASVTDNVIRAFQVVTTTASVQLLSTNSTVNSALNASMVVLCHGTK